MSRKSAYLARNGRLYKSIALQIILKNAREAESIARLYTIKKRPKWAGFGDSDLESCLNISIFGMNADLRFFHKNRGAIMLTTDLQDFKNIMIRYIDEAYIDIRDQALKSVAESITNTLNELNADTESGYRIRKDEIRVTAEKRKDQFQQWLNDNRFSMEIYGDSWEKVILHLISVVSEQEKELLDNDVDSWNNATKWFEDEKVKLIREHQGSIQGSIDEIRIQTHEAMQGAQSIDEIVMYCFEFLKSANNHANINLKPSKEMNLCRLITDNRSLRNIRNTLSFSEERTFLKKIARSRMWDNVNELIQYTSGESLTSWCRRYGKSNRNSRS